MTQTEAIKLLEIIKQDDLTAFCTLIENEPSILYVSLGRFPLLSICYIYNSKKIVNKHKNQLNKINNYKKEFEPFVLYKDFKKICGRTIKLFADNQETVLPIEILAVLQKDSKLKKDFFIYSNNNYCFNRIEKIYKTYKRKFEVKNKKIKISAKKLSKTQKKAIIWANFAIFCVLSISLAVVATIAGTIGLGTTFSPRKVYSAEDFSNIAKNSNLSISLQNDITISNGFYAQSYNGTIYGNNKTLTINYEYSTSMFENFNGQIKDLKIENNSSEIDITKDLSLLCNSNYGLVENVNIQANISAQFDGYNPSTYFCGFAVYNHKTIKNCSAKLAVNANSISGKDSYICGVSAKNYGTIENCQISSDSSFDGKNVDMAGIAIENYAKSSISNCKNFCDIAQTSNIATWSPTIGGIAVANRGTIENCYNYGNLTINNEVQTENNAVLIIGGICAYNYKNILHSKNDGNISANCNDSIVYVGGICGQVDDTIDLANNPTISSCITSGNFSINRQNDSTMLYCGGIAGFMVGTLSDSCSISTFECEFDINKKSMTGLVVGASYYQYLYNNLLLTMQNVHCLTSAYTDVDIAILFTEFEAITEYSLSFNSFVTRHPSIEDIKASEVYWD